MSASKFRPYPVTHLTLDELQSFSPPENNCYIVFWFNKIPLGHLWYEKKSGRQTFKKEAVQAMLWALNYYSGRDYTDAGEWISLIDSGDIAEILSLKEKPLTPGTISVVICTRNRAEALKRCITQLLRSHDTDFELIVVDNASDDDHTRKTAESFPGVKYVREERKGLDIARNTGIRNAGHNIIAFTDDDVSVDPTWIAEIKRSFFDPMIMSVTGMIIPLEIKSKAQYVFEHDWSFNKGYLPKVFDHKYFRDYEDYGVPAWDIGAGASMAFRKEIFQIVGHFDERLDVGAAGCSGDSEMWYRILAEGWNCYYNPGLLVYHQHRSTMKELRHQLFSYMRGHVSALLVQYENYGHAGNLLRLRHSLPRWYAGRIKLFLKTLDTNYINTIHKEIAGYISGLRFYKRNRGAARQREPLIEPVLLEPAVVTPEALVSVIIPCYNYGHFLQEAIDSVKRQTYPYHQIIVVDDGSEDNTSQVCWNNPGITYVRTERVGVSAARNIGVAHSSGDFLVFLDADDILYPNALELNLFYFRHIPEIVMAAGAYDLADEKGTPLPNPVEPRQHKEDFYESLLQGNFIGMQSNVMYRRRLFFSFSFDAKLKACEDYDLNLRISRRLPACSHTEKIAAYRKHSQNASVNSSLMRDAAISLLNKQKAYLNSTSEIKAFEEGKINWSNHYA